MAGSRVFRQYTDDAGNNYAINIDESNAEAVVEGNVLMPPRSADVEAIPRGLIPRYVLATLQSNPLVKRKFKVGGVTQVNSLLKVGSIVRAAVNASADDSSGGTQDNFVVTFYRGEQRRLIPSFQGTSTDTGLLDGDPD